MKNSILKIMLVALLFTACDSGTSSKKKTEAPPTKPIEKTMETPSTNLSNKNTNEIKSLTLAQPKGNREYYGMYTYMADANRFTSCDKTVKMSIAMKGKYLDLERRYLTVADGGDKVFIHFKGKIEKVPAMEGGGTEDALLISELMEVDKAKKCD